MRFLLISLVLLSGGCGLADRADDQRDEVVARSEIRGKWAAACAPSSLFEAKFAILRYDLGVSGTFTFTNEIYLDEACQTLGLVQEVVGDYTLPGDENKDEPTAIDFEIEDVTLVPKQEATAKELSDATYCGISDWALDATRQVENVGCDGFLLAEDDKLHDLIQVKDEQLFLGTPELIKAPTEAADRPTALDVAVPFDAE